MPDSSLLKLITRGSFSQSRLESRERNLKNTVKSALEVEREGRRGEGEREEEIQRAKGSERRERREELNMELRTHTHLGSV